MSGSWLVIRFQSSLDASCLGEMARSPDSTREVAPSVVSSRNPACCFSASGPWHLKQFDDRIGLTSRLKSTGESADDTPIMPEK